MVKILRSLRVLWQQMRSFDSDTNVETLPSQTQGIADIEEYEYSEGDHSMPFCGYCQRLSCFSHTCSLLWPS